MENNRKSFHQHVETKFFVLAIIRGEEGAIPQPYSVTARTLCYTLALLHNALGLWRKVIASNSYRSWRKGVATYNYRSCNIWAVIAAKSYCSDS